MTNEVIPVAFVNELDFNARWKLAPQSPGARREMSSWKGATSRETFELVEVRVNCENNSLGFRGVLDVAEFAHKKHRWLADEPLLPATQLRDERS